MSESECPHSSVRITVKSPADNERGTKDADIMLRAEWKGVPSPQPLLVMTFPARTSFTYGQSYGDDTDMRTTSAAVIRGGRL